MMFLLLVVAVVNVMLGSGVISTLCPVNVRLPLLKPNSRKKGTPIIKGYPGT